MAEVVIPKPDLTRPSLTRPPKGDSKNFETTSSPVRLRANVAVRSNPTIRDRGRRA